MGWIELSYFSHEVLAEAKKQIHQAAQLPAIAGRCLNPEDSGDNFAALIWDKNHNRLISQPLGKSEFHAALRISEFQLIITNEKGEPLTYFTLDSKTYEEAFNWLAENLSQFGFDPNNLNKDLPYQIPEYPTAKGTPFKQANPEAFAELQYYYSNAAFLLENITKKEKDISQVLCWPHHFDIAALITIERNPDPEKSKTFGVGLSPGDQSYNEPYFYISPWPYPQNKDELPKLYHGHWHKQGWLGIVLTAGELLKEKDKSEQYALTETFIDTGLNILKKFL